MKYTDLKYNTGNEEEITKNIIYSNETFDVKKVLSHNTPENECAVSIITPTQEVDVSFPYNNSPGGHAGIAQLILERINPEYQTHNYGSTKIFTEERKDNIFILASETIIIVIMPKEDKMTKKQYNKLKKYMEEIKNSDYIKSGKIEDIFFAQDSGDNVVEIGEIDKKMEELQSNIIEKDMPKQYPIVKFDFSRCKTEEEIMEQAGIYAKELNGYIEKLKRSTRVLLNKKQKEYRRILSKIDSETIEDALNVLNNNDNIDLNIEQLKPEIKEIFEQMKKYQQDIKQVFIDNGENIIHISNIAPEEITEGKISKMSTDSVRQDEAENKNWEFTSYDTVDNENSYMAIMPQDEMVMIDTNTYIYDGNNIYIQQDEQNQNKVMLEKPKYIYKINPENFIPIVTLKKNKKGNPYFDFSGKWILDKDVDITNPEQLREVEEVTDITDIVEKCQILCDVNSAGVGRIIQDSPREEGIKRLFSGIEEGELRYINGEAGINVSNMINNGTIVNSIGKSTIDRDIEDKDRAKKEVQKEEKELNKTEEK